MKSISSVCISDIYQMKKILALIFCVSSISSFSQKDTLNILFLGNSYTQFNNLPSMVETLIEETGVEVITDANTPGGYTLKQHSTNATSIQKIKQGVWDFVVLQEQSQLPSFPLGQVQQETFPYAKTLDTLITKHNPCAETIFYNTWGRKNGDAGNCGFWPPVCTYEGMDSMLALRYKYMADTNKALVSPVGPVWRNIRENYPTINLYTSDESHPSIYGSYAAAVSFFAVITRKDPTFITNNFGFTQIDADNIKQAAKEVAYNQLNNWNVGEYDAKAFFETDSFSPFEVAFENKSIWANEFIWDFGDGESSTEKSPTHTYTDTGSYNIYLISSYCGVFPDTFSVDLKIKNNNNSVGLEEVENRFMVYPNPANSVLNISGIVNGELELRDISGKLVLKSKIKPIVGIENLEKGLYFLTFTTNSSIETQSVLIIN